MTAPQVSVVMGVHNGASDLGRTLESVRSQQGVELELICVDDGSTDATFEVLSAAAARDPRIRPLRQPHEGLTSALVRGCEAARGDLIARQDAGDCSLPGRLAAQAAILRKDGAAVFVSCATRFVTGGGLHLYEVGRAARRTMKGTLPSATSWPGPSHHGATMFRRHAFEEVGGYRRAFGVAQDFDLWLRLLDLGDHVAMPEVLYEATFAPVSLSGTQRRRQLHNARIALACAQARRSGAAEAHLLARCSAAPITAEPPGPRRRAEALYFIGACLRENPQQARRHFLLAVRAWPLHLRSWLRLAALATTRTRNAEAAEARATTTRGPK
jgi:hypothetical protein